MDDIFCGLLFNRADYTFSITADLREKVNTIVRGAELGGFELSEDMPHNIAQILDYHGRSIDWFKDEDGEPNSVKFLMGVAALTCIEGKIVGVRLDETVRLIYRTVQLREMLREMNRPMAWTSYEGALRRGKGRQWRIQIVREYSQFLASKREGAKTICVVHLE